MARCVMWNVRVCHVGDKGSLVGGRGCADPWRRSSLWVIVRASRSNEQLNAIAGVSIDSQKHLKSESIFRIS